VFKVPLASSGLRASDVDLAVQVLESGNLTMGKSVKNFEEAMATYLKVDSFVMVNSGSSANLLMMESLLRPTLSDPKLHPGDSVLVPAIAWPTTVWPIIQLGLNPIFVDIDPETLALDLNAAQQVISKGKIPVKAIFPIHPLGLAIPSEMLFNFSELNNLVLINDVCESLGSWENGKHAGTVGSASSFSFYFSHHITTMEGGGIATNDPSLADDLKSMRSHGWSRDRSDANDWHRGHSETDSRFLFVSTGYNVRPMEIQAAIGIRQLASLDGFIEKRRKIASAVYDAISGSSLELIGYRLFAENPSCHSWMLLPIRIIGKNAAQRREKIVNFLLDQGIETRPVLTGNFLAQPAIQRITRQTMPPEAFQNASLVSSTSFLVSCHHDLSDDQVTYLGESLKLASRI
jgi:CDP-6-deoxy-D-xylo-4-hexulose-3-dehydrase